MNTTKAYLRHPTGSLMRFDSEEKKEEFLRLMRNQSYYLYDWFMSYQEPSESNDQGESKAPNDKFIVSSI